MIGFGLNLALAVVWFLLGDPPTAQRFVTGFLLGFLIVLAGERALPDAGYTRRTFAAVRFVLWFAVALVRANHAMAVAILTRRRRAMRPVVVDYPVEDLGRGEILLLSHCITLTPGTLTVDVAPDFSRLRLHVFDGQDVEEVIAGIRTGLEKPILAFTR
jgi:multicomponent Na+:H+ antiporter subunit E